MTVRLAVPLVAACVVWAQAPQKLEYACPPEDVDAFGLSCSSSDPCPVFLELASVEGLGAKLFLAGNLHTATITLYGVLLASEDGGKTWAEPHRRVRAATLEQIQLADFQHGFVGGVKLEPLARDAFLLATTDGGKTWRELPVFEETRYGSIQQFWFDSAKTGELIFDRSQGATKRYELYSTMTGGDTWDVREVTTKQPALSKAQTRTNATWRLRPDSASKTYRVEQRTTAGWETVSTFTVHIADCQ